MMKTKAKLTAVVLVMLLLFVGVKVVSSNNRSVSFQEQEIAFSYPDHIWAIVDNKCYGCHNIEGRNENAKEALLWDSIPRLSLAGQLSTLQEIMEVVEEGTMPPAMMVERNPDLALTADESSALINWADSTSNSLLD